MNLIPDFSARTGNYFCTWDSQCDEMYSRNPEAEYIPCRDAMCEDFLFGENGVMNSFDGCREDLIAVIDDGWDVPYGATDRRLFGSLIADEARFPSLKNLKPTERLKSISDKVKSLGYKGLGLWVPTQTPSLVCGREVSLTPEEERLYWEERARWCNEAGIIYLKADWGKHQGDADYCNMMTECFRRFAPGVLVEHGLRGVPLFENENSSHKLSQEHKNYLRSVLPACDYLRTYDVVHELKYASTVHRAAVSLEAAKEIEGKCAVLNIEDTALIGAALGCSVGIMRHEAEKRRKYLPLPPRPVGDSVSALRWQRIAPPFAANRGEVHISDERLKDVWYCPKRASNLWPRVSEGEYFFTAPASVSRNMPLPQVKVAGEKPYVLCSVHPDNGALCVAATPRAFSGKLYAPVPAQVSVKGKSPHAPVGIFGTFDSLEIEFEEPLDNCRIIAQSLLTGSVSEITSRVTAGGNALMIPGALINEISDIEKTDCEIPAIAVVIKKQQ